MAQYGEYESCEKSRMDGIDHHNRRSAHTLRTRIERERELHQQQQHTAAAAVATAGAEAVDCPARNAAQQQ